MAIQYNENIKIAAPNPLDKRYLSNRVSGGGQVPYSATTEVFSTIIVGERYIGLTVNVNGTEYWFKDNINTLVEKTSGAGSIVNAVTGATNVGFFNGFSGIEVVYLNKLGGVDESYDGRYQSVYGYYYRGTDAKIHVGTPTDGIQKRAYVKYPTIDNPTTKSWIWNEYTGNGIDQLGWILVDLDVTQQIGNSVTGVVYYPPATPYTQTSWITGTNPNNGSNLVIDYVVGSLVTGNTITVGAPVYRDKTGQNLNFRTIKSETPNTVNVRFDEGFVYVSGKTQVTQGQNIGTGSPVFKQLSGNTLQFRGIKGSGDTIVTQSGNDIVIFSSGGSGSVATYNLSSPAAIGVGGINAGDILTGKTAFQLFEQLLVPAIPAVVTPPDNTFVKSSPSASQFEVGQTIGLTFNATFSRGLINPLYFGTPPYSSVPRSGLPNTYTYTGTGLPVSVSSALLTNTQTIASYGVLAGSQSWTNTVSYASGATPVYDSKGTVISPALAANTTSVKTISITGIYPYFYGISDTAPVAGTALLGTGTKMVTTSTVDVTVNFNASAKYLWLAIPTSTPKNKWYGSNAPTTNTESIPGGLFNAPTTASVNSPTSLWTGINYDFYISNYKTSTIAGGTPYTITFTRV